MSPQTLDFFALISALGGLATCAIIALRQVRALRATVAASVAAAGDRGEDAPAPSLWRALVAPLAVHLRPTVQAEIDVLHNRLQRAGRRHRNGLDRFLEGRVLIFIGALVFAIAIAIMIAGGAGSLLAITIVALGYMGPDMILDRIATDRRDAVMRSLPSAVDLLVTCLDAGLPLEQSVARVAKDLAHSSPVLAEELGITASEFDAGVSLPDALRRLARRVGLDDLSALCGVIAQASALGAPIAQTLREYATSSRRQRLSALEEHAGKLATKLTIPLALCLLPSAMMVIIGPVAINIMRMLAL